MFRSGFFPRLIGRGIGVGELPACTLGLVAYTSLVFSHSSTRLVEDGSCPPKAIFVVVGFVAKGLAGSDLPGIVRVRSRTSLLARTLSTSPSMAGLMVVSGTFNTFAPRPFIPPLLLLFFHGFLHPLNGPFNPAVKILISPPLKYVSAHSCLVFSLLLALSSASHSSSSDAASYITVASQIGISSKSSSGTGRGYSGTLPRRCGGLSMFVNAEGQ